jgi:hypothetical protein
MKPAEREISERDGAIKRFTTSHFTDYSFQPVTLNSGRVETGPGCPIQTAVSSSFGWETTNVQPTLVILSSRCWTCF